MSRTALAIALPPARLGAQLVVVRSSRTRRRVLIRHFVAPCILFVALAAQLYVRMSIVERGYELEQLRSHVVMQDTKLRAIELDFAFLTRPQMLTTRAARTLRMMQPSPVQVRRFAENGRL